MPEIKPLRWRWLDWTLVSTATIVAGVLRFHALDRKPFWLDEGVSVAISRLDWYNFIRLMWRREANMSLYYVLLRGWQHLGGSEFFLRSLSVVFAVATVPAIYWLGLRLFDRRVATIASFIFALNAYSIRYAQEARSYSLYVFLGTLSWIFFIEYIRNSSARLRRAFICFSALAVYAHLYFAFFIVAQWIVARLYDRKAMPPEMTAAFRWIGAITFPAFLFAATTDVGPLRWVQRPGISDVYGYYDHMAGNGGPWLVAACFIAIVLALQPVIRTVTSRDSCWGTWRFQLLILWMFFPTALVLLLSLARRLFVPRYLIACQAAFLVLVAAGVCRLSRTWAQVAVVAFLAILSLRGTLAYYDHDFDLDREDYRSATRYLLEHAAPGDVVVFDIAQGRMPYEFYRSVYRGPGVAPRVIYPSIADRLDYRDFMGRATPDVIRGAREPAERVWMVRKTNAGASDSDVQQLSDALSKDYPTVENRAFAGVELRLYSSGARLR